MARHATASQLERICRSYRRVRTAAELEGRPESLADEELRRFVRTTDTDDGMVRIEARLRPEEAAMLLQALDVARRLAWRSRPSRDGGNDDGPGVAASDVSGETSRRHPALSRADALVAVAEAFLASAARDDKHVLPGAGAAPVELVVHVDAAALRASGDTITAADSDTDARDDADRHHDPDPMQHHATLADGTALSIATAQRLACDAAVVTVAYDAAGKVTLASRRARRISSTLRRALRSRDDGCRFPGCTNRITDAHHVVAWAYGGATTLRNLCSLCRRHHRLVHEHGYRIETAADGDLRFVRRDGTPVPLADERRVALVPTRDAVTALRDAHAGRGLVIDASTAFPRWDGEPVDYALAVDALLAGAPRMGAAAS